MFDHVKIGVSDFAASKAFYTQALAPLGIKLGAEGEPSYGAEFVNDGVASWIIFQSDETPAHLHIAFAAQTRAQVDAF